MQLLRNTNPQAPTDISFDELGFGSVYAPHMFRMSYYEGAWHNARIEPLTHFELHPAAMVFHYAQTIFEGLKAYRHPDGSIALFRPDKNMARMNLSADRLCMPRFDPDFLLDAILELVATDAAWVPPAPGSLYIRPVMIATQKLIKVAPAEEYELYVITSPVGSYFKDVTNPPGAVKVFVTRDYIRAAPGGIGAAKTGGNYAASLYVQGVAQEKSCGQVLWLSAVDHDTIEELGGMNVFVLKDGVLYTPPISDTILNGVTRRSILQLAQEAIEVREESLKFSEVVAGLKDGSVTEIFACGTAAVVTAISHLVTDDNTYQIGDGSVGELTRSLYQNLTGIQYGKQDDPYGWVRKVTP